MPDTRVERALWKPPPHPFVFEINTWPWLDELGRRHGRLVGLGDVPEAEWHAIAAEGFDAVWLMGVWQRSPAGVALARANPTLIESFRAALPDFRPEDVVGSPYCVRDYVVDDHLGGPDGLAAARAALADRGLGVFLDFVPNHVAPDHPWTVAHPDRFVRGSADDLRNDPESFVAVAGHILANGRDPFFPAWPDVVQLDAFSEALRAAVIETLRSIASQCDGVRCDMAMLVMNDTFERTWGEMVGPRPAADFWPTVIPAVRETNPDVVFLAEAYWDLEWALQEQGFDFCYDKRLYDRLVHEGPEQVRLHLQADIAYQDKLLRFVENHDEPRAAAVFDGARERAATVATLTQTGARLVHHGEAEGRRVRLPVFLGRFPEETPDEALRAFHWTLFTALRDPTFRNGRWRQARCDGWPGDERVCSLVAWTWEGETRWLVAVNLAGDPTAGQVTVPWADLRGRDWQLVDPTNDVKYQRSGDSLCDGLYVELGPWAWHLFRIDPATDAS